MKAVLFDLYETLITEWSGEKYTSAACAADLGVSTPVFREHWEALHDAMNTGALTYKQALCRIGMSAGMPPLRAMWFLDGHQPSSMPFEEVGRPEEVPERCESK